VLPNPPARDAGAAGADGRDADGAWNPEVVRGVIGVTNTPPPDR
jgi:hypothetical protein